MATLTAVTVTRESWPRHSCLLSPIDLPEATAILLEGTNNSHKICLWALRSRELEAGRVELPSWARKELGSEVSVSVLSDQDDSPASWRLIIPACQPHWPDVLQAISLNPEVLRSAAERQLQQWPFLAQGHSVYLNLLGQSVKFTLEESELGGGLLAGFALPRSHSVTPPPPAKDCLYYNSHEDLRFADSLALSAFEILTFRPDRRSFTNLLHNLRPKAVTLLDVSHTPVNSEVCDGLWEACHRLRVPLLVVARDNLATVAGAWLSKFDKGDMIDCSPVTEDSTVSTSAAASVPCFGLEEQRKLLKEAVVFPFVYPNLYRQMGLRPSARVLVYGTSGSGKTTLIDSVLADFMPSRVSIVRVDVAGIFGKYLGSTERNLQRHFDAARLKLPAVLILDGLESIATAREEAADDDGTSGTYRRTLTTLLTCLDGVDADVEESLAVVATSTTPPDKLDPAVVRPGRFDKWIEVHRVADLDCMAANEDLSHSETAFMTGCPPTSISCDAAGAVSTPYDDYNGSYNNYPRGVYWAPRGKHLMSYFADNTCRVFDADQGLARPVRTERAPGTITAMEMCPLGSEPSDFHYAVSVRDRPIHLVNLLTGEVAASYQGFSLTDEVTAASCLSFSQDGSRLLGGVAGQPQVWLWDLTRPGKSTYHRVVLSTRKGKTGQRGIVSAAAWLDDKCYALGTYSRTIGIYDERHGSKKNAKCVKMLSAPDGGGITSLKLSPQGLLVSGHRTDTSMRVWDIRSSGTEPVTTLPRASKTNQRFDFSFLGNSRILATGDDSGHVLWYDILTGELLSSCLVSSSGTPCVAAQIEPVSCSRIAVATGQRVWPTYVSMGDDENTELLQPKTDNRVAVVKFSAPEGLLSAALPSAAAAEVAAEPQQQSETVPASEPEEAAPELSAPAEPKLPPPPEPQPVVVPDTFKGLPPPPGVAVTSPCSEGASNGIIAGPPEPLPSQAEADAGSAGEKTDDVDMVDAAKA